VVQVFDSFRVVISTVNLVPYEYLKWLQNIVFLELQHFFLSWLFLYFMQILN